MKKQLTLKPKAVLVGYLQEVRNAEKAALDRKVVDEVDDIADVSYAEAQRIARKLGITTGAVMVSVSRINKLRKGLERYKNHEQAK